jgi:hypothetical protein
MSIALASRTRAPRRAVLLLSALLLSTIGSVAARAQGPAELPMTAADSLLEEGRWAEAEALFYAQSTRAPRNPVARAALGRYVAMRGAVRPGMVMIEEARRFGLDAAVAESLIAPLREVLEWRAAAAELRRDSTLAVRPSESRGGLFQISLPRSDSKGAPLTSTGVSEIVWYDVVDRGIGLDSLSQPARPLGIEIFEAFVPAFDLTEQELTLYANPRRALSATGTRYRVLRTERGIRVLITDGRVMALSEALRELRPTWWQLDLPHGLLVAR